MIGIFLVDDEVYALKVLEKKIRDLQGPYEIVGTAENGTEALALIDEVKPAILMTDIRMPGMDGIALIEALQKRGYNDLLPVIISGYQEFEYAKQAVRLGVQDYLLKPIVPNELRSCLDACVAQLQKRSRTDNVVSFLIGDESVSLEIVPGTYEYVVAYVIEGNALGNYQNIIHPNIPYVPIAEVKDLVSSVFTSPVVCHCFDGFFSNEKALVLAMEHYDEDIVARQLEQVAGMLQLKTGSYITLQFGLVPTTGGVASSIRALRRDALQNLYWGETKVSLQAYKNYKRDSKVKERSELFYMLIRQNDTALLRTNIAKMFKEWSSDGHMAASMQEDMILLLDLLSNRFGKVEKTSAGNSFSVENIICFSSTVDEIAENYALLLMELYGNRQKTETRGIGGEELVERTIKYFKENLHTNLSLQMVTGEIGVKKAYLCRIFKKHKDLTPIEYFTNMKINKAKSLIQQNPNIPMREIAEQLGFTDIYYFSKVYKRVTGHSPSEDRT